MTSIRVALADDHPVVLAGIASLLEAAPDVTVVGEAKTCEEALELIDRTQPDVAVIDISMPAMNGLEMARQLSQTHSHVKLLTLTAHEDRAYVQPMLHNGARGYLLKRSAAEELLRAVRAVAEGGIYLDPAIAGKAVLQAHGPEGDLQQPVCDLSPREEQVLKLAACGFSNKEIAGRLNVSVKSVETYKSRATDKLGLRSRAEIVSYGACRGWLNDIAGL